MGIKYSAFDRNTPSGDLNITSISVSSGLYRRLLARYLFGGGESLLSTGPVDKTLGAVVAATVDSSGAVAATVSPLSAAASGCDVTTSVEGGSTLAADTGTTTGLGAVLLAASIDCTVATQGSSIDSASEANGTDTISEAGVDAPDARADGREDATRELAVATTAGTANGAVCERCSSVRGASAVQEVVIISAKFSTSGAADVAAGAVTSPGSVAP